MSDEYEVLYNVLPELAAALHEIVSQAVRKSAFDIQKLAAENAPVDTGYLKSSIYTVTRNASTYGQNLASGPPGSSLLDAVPAPESDTEAVVGVGANYGIYVETGTVHAPAQPYLMPAVEEERPKFIAALSRMEEHLKGGGGGGGSSSGGSGS